MAPPAQIPCPSPGCGWKTPENIPTYDLVTTHLQLHVSTNHAAGGGPSHNTAKVDKRPRPEATQDMSEHAFRFFESEWSLYKRATGISGQTLIDELWTCMNTDLKQLVFDQGSTELLDTEEKMMSRIKSLAVAVLHTAVHTVRLHEAEQISDESCKAFAARARGMASNCQLNKKCTCGVAVSYLEETVYHVVLAGLRDKELQEACTTQALLGNIKDISTLIEYCTAKESGNLGSVTVGGIKSAHQKRKFQSPLATPSHNLPPAKCHHCGQKNHGSKEAREKECKAFSATCTNCGKKSHFAAMCKSRTQTAAAVEEKRVTLDHGALHFGFCAIEAGSWDYPDPSRVVTRSNYPSIPTSNSFSVLATIAEIEEPTWSPPARAKGTRPPSTPSPPRQRWSRTGRRKKQIPLAQNEVADLEHQLNQQAKPLSSATPPCKVPLCHMEHDSNLGWREITPMDSPILPVTLEIHVHTYTALKLPPPVMSRPHKTKVRSVADSGAQLNIIPVREITAMGIKIDSLLPVSVRVSGASQGSSINIVGGVLLRVKGLASKSCSSLQLFYVANNVSRTYLSLSTLKALRVVPVDFPKVGMDEDIVVAANGQAVSGPARCTNTGVVQPGDKPCSCPNRTVPPVSPPKLPCSPTPENVPRIKQYLLDRYSSSSFNCCERQPLPLMKSSPPIKLHVDLQAKPVAVHVPALVPIHWQLGVKEGLDRDCRLGVLERVPPNTPTTWLHRMCVTAKHDGTPRRTIDFRNLNKHAPRQTHHTPSPWNLVSSIPAGVFKSTFDCWHGYHSLQLAEEDRDLTTFISPWGRYRYLTLPQGVLSAGDGYTQRLDSILEGFQRLRRCIDDNLLWDETIEDQFFRCCDFLDTCGRQGVILNPHKFQFASKTVDFLGFKLTEQGVQPMDGFIEDILSFPTPANITDVRSFFGAIAQVSYSFAISPTMLPFRHLLSSKVPFSWSAELDTAFGASKQEIVRQCKAGVRSFSPTLPTCLATDYSKFALGYWLCQKHCSCPGTIPGCCSTGWQTVYVGSRFCKQAEQNYAPIEGEACAAAWAAEKCKYFLLGLPNFTLALDHKPLLSILADKELGDVTNPRLRNQKDKLLPFRFTPVHIAGKEHVVPDAWSRRSDSPIPAQPITTGYDLTDVSNIDKEYSSHFGPPSWVTSPHSTPDTYQIAALGVSLHAEDSEDIDDVDSEMEALIAGMAMQALHELSASCQVAGQTPVRVITWEILQEAAAKSIPYQLLVSFIAFGLPEDSKDWPKILQQYYPYRHSLLVMDNVVLFGERPLIPDSLQQEVLSHLHAAHTGNTNMMSRAAQSVFWPGMKQDIISTRAHCTSCTRNAPSNPNQPPEPPTQPDFPFSHVCMDFFAVNGLTYLALCDRYTGWLSILCLKRDDSAHVISALREYFSCWGVAKHITSDGASVFTSAACKDFLHRWGVKHRVSSAYYPRANKRSELAVKSAKRIIMDNLGRKGELDTDRMARSLLAHRNTPDPMTGLSPAMILFGRELRDHLPAVLSKYRPRKEWRIETEHREKAFAKRHSRMEERLQFGAKPLQPLSIGDTVVVQDQSNPLKPGKWTKTGTVVEILPHHSYMVIIHGSREPTQRNRKFLRKITPFHPMIPHLSHPILQPPVQHRDTQPDHLAPQGPSHHAHPSAGDDDGHAVQSSPGHAEQLGDNPPGPSDDRHPVQLTAAPPQSRQKYPPPHLRERWIVAKPSPHAADDQGPGPADSERLPQGDGPSLPSALAYRDQPAAPPGQDAISLLLQREKDGQRL